MKIKKLALIVGITLSLPMTTHAENESVIDKFHMLSSTIQNLKKNETNNYCKTGMSTTALKLDQASANLQENQPFFVEMYSKEAIAQLAFLDMSSCDQSAKISTAYADAKALYKLAMPNENDDDLNRKIDVAKKVHALSTNITALTITETNKQCKNNMGLIASDLEHAGINLVADPTFTFTHMYMQDSVTKLALLDTLSCTQPVEISGALTSAKELETLVNSMQ